MSYDLCFYADRSPDYHVKRCCLGGKDFEPVAHIKTHGTFPAGRRLSFCWISLNAKAEVQNKLFFTTRIGAGRYFMHLVCPPPAAMDYASDTFEKILSAEYPSAVHKCIWTKQQFTDMRDSNTFQFYFIGHLFLPI